MAPKRKSDSMDHTPLGEVSGQQASLMNMTQTTLDPPAKKARVADPSGASGSTSKGKKTSDKPMTWKDITLPGEDESSVPVYDDCGEVRRKIRLLQKQPGWKVTQWLKDIGGINNNSYGRFMREKGKTDGATNGTYYAGYIYFEKVRILEGKKKTATRESNEIMHPYGFPLENRRKVWVITGR
ncbi:hypothetical protein BDZ97DRAFT_1651637 [Flammula alnicola]|nr:hypothetical protein BDZ97DRAFT_1651637 [Flammula alnicola]